MSRMTTSTEWLIEENQITVESIVSESWSNYINS